MSQEEISSTEKQSQKSQVIKNPCTQIFKFMDGLCEKSFPGNDESDLLMKCPDYESDEFADVEDNAKDSSDNNESTSDVAGLVLVERDGDFYPGGGTELEYESSMKRIPADFSSSSETVLSEEEDVPSASLHVQGYNIGASCSHTSDHGSKDVPNSTGPDAKPDGERDVKFKLPETAVPADFFDRTGPKDGKSSRQKATPLKMKTKVGIRKDKCNVCRARLGLCAIKCRCGGYYCAKHRYDKEHNCTFDYKSMGAEEIRKNNPRIIAEKVRKL